MPLLFLTFSIEELFHLTLKRIMFLCPEKETIPPQNKSSWECNSKSPQQHGLLKSHHLYAVLTPLTAYMEQQKDYATI